MRKEYGQKPTKRCSHRECRLLTVWYELLKESRPGARRPDAGAGRMKRLLVLAQRVARLRDHRTVGEVHQEEDVDQEPDQRRHDHHLTILEP